MKTKAELDALLAKTQEITRETAAATKALDDLEKRNKAADDQAKANALAGGSFAGTRASGGNSAMSSDEQRALRYFGCSSLKQLLDVNTGDTRFKGVPDELKYLVRTVKSEFDTARIVAQLFRGDKKDRLLPNGDEQLAVCKSMLLTPYGKDVLTARLKTFGSTTSGAGADWVPTAVSSQYVQEFELEHSLDQKFRNINMPTNPYKLSVQKGVTGHQLRYDDDQFLGAKAV